MLLALLVGVPFVSSSVPVGGVDAPILLAGAVLLVVPAALCVLGVHQLRRRIRMPEDAVTITPAAVLFPVIERPSALAPQVRTEEWAREETSVRLVPASGLSAARVEFTRLHGGTTRRRSIAADDLDVDAHVIVAALSEPPAQR